MAELTLPGDDRRKEPVKVAIGNGSASINIPAEIYPYTVWATKADSDIKVEDLVRILQEMREDEYHQQHNLAESLMDFVEQAPAVIALVGTELWQWYLDQIPDALGEEMVRQPSNIGFEEVAKYNLIFCFDRLNNAEKSDLPEHQRKQLQDTILYLAREILSSVEIAHGCGWTGRKDPSIYIRDEIAEVVGEHDCLKPEASKLFKLWDEPPEIQNFLRIDRIRAEFGGDLKDLNLVDGANRSLNNRKLLYQLQAKLEPKDGDDSWFFAVETIAEIAKSHDLHLGCSPHTLISETRNRDFFLYALKEMTESLDICTLHELGWVKYFVSNDPQKRPAETFIRLLNEYFESDFGTYVPPLSYCVDIKDDQAIRRCARAFEFFEKLRAVAEKHGIKVLLSGGHGSKIEKELSIPGRARLMTVSPHIVQLHHTFSRDKSQFRTMMLADTISDSEIDFSEEVDFRYYFMAVAHHIATKAGTGLLNAGLITAEKFDQVYKSVPLEQRRSLFFAVENQPSFVWHGADPEFISGIIYVHKGNEKQEDELLVSVDEDVLVSK